MNVPITKPETTLQLDPRKLHDSSLQKKRVSDRGNLDEMAASMKAVGVIEPLLARPHPSKPDEYELVCGHRRKRSAIKAGLETVPVIVRNLDDDQVLEIQMIENSERADVHPLDEADNFEAMVKRGKEPSEIAARIGRPVGYVLKRLTLCQLGDESRKALDEDKITLELAVLIARIPDEKLQKQALEQLQATEYEPAVTVREGSQIIRDKFMLKLADAPFDRASETLVKKVGACTNCPKRTGAQAELFADVDSPDLCTDPTCYRGKLDAHWKVTAAEAKKKGTQVLDDNKAKKVFAKNYGDATVHDSPLVSLDETKYRSSGGSVKVRDLLKGKDVTVTLGRNPHTGKVHELVPAAVVAKALGKKPVSGSSSSKKGRSQPREQAPDLEEIGHRAVVVAIGNAVERGSAAKQTAALRFLVIALADPIRAPDGVLDHRGANRKNIAGWAMKASSAQLLGAVVELIVAEDIGYGSTAASVTAFCRTLGVDAKAIEKKAIADAKAAEASKAEKPKSKPAQAKGKNAKPAKAKPSSKGKASKKSKKGK